MLGQIICIIVVVVVAFSVPINSHVADTDCPILGKPISGRKYGSEYNHGDIVIFECDQGFVLKGSAVRRCMENGTWNGTDAICRGKLYGATCLIAFS